MLLMDFMEKKNIVQSNQSSQLYSWFSRDVINILKCKITEPLSCQLSLVIKHAKYIFF